MNTTPGTPATRLVSADALRGFDMLWICGADALVRAIAKADGSPFWAGLAFQMEHAGWTGFRFYDLIFPLFLFLSGLTIPWSLGRRMEQGSGKWALSLRALGRWCTLVLLGVVYNGGLQLKPLADTRMFSVLGLIGTGWLIAALLFLHAKPRTRVVWATAILIGYGLLLEFFPVPGHGAGIHTAAEGLTGWVDRFMPWHLYQGNVDPEGLLPCLASSFVALAGCFTGDFLKRSPRSPVVNAGILALAGLAAVGCGWLAALSMPISKPQWNPPFMLVCTGCSLGLLAVFHLVFDTRFTRRAVLPLAVIGANPILIYLLLRIVPVETVSEFFFGGVTSLVPGPWQETAAITAFIATWWLLLWFLYRKKWFLRV